MSDYNLTRTLLSRCYWWWSSRDYRRLLWVIGLAKGKAGKFYDKGNGFKGDLDKDAGFGGKMLHLLWSGKDGKLTKKNVDIKVKDKITK